MRQSAEQHGDNTQEMKKMHEDTSEEGRWRKERFNQDVYLLDTVRGRVTVSQEDGIRISIEQSPFLTPRAWDEIKNQAGRSPPMTDRYCIDAGQNWYIHNIRQKVNAVFGELWSETIPFNGRHLTWQEVYGDVAIGAET